MPAFYIKILAVVAAVTIVRLLWTRVFSDRASVDTGSVPGKDQVLAGALLVSWTVAVTAGRVTAYLPLTGWKTAAALVILTAVLWVGGYVVVRLRGAKTSA